MAKHRKALEPGVAQPGLDPQVLDQLVGETRTMEELDLVFRQLKKALIERALGAELTEHLGYARGEAKPDAQANCRNGATPKTVRTEEGEIPLAIPRDRAGTFEPQLVPKGVRRLPGFDAKVLALYARGMTVREIQGHLEELYQVAVAPDVITTVTDAVLDEVSTWQQRPLDRVYPVVIFDALRLKVRDEGVVRNKAVYVALGVTREGQKDVLGLWIEQTEGAAFRLRIMTELQSRGVSDILVALIDGLTGFPDAITTVFPQAQVQQCTVHVIRQSLRYVSARDRQAVVVALRTIYAAPTEPAALQALEAFAAGPWGARYAMIPQLWRRHWDYLAPAFRYPPAIRRLLYTTNAIESLNMQLRKIVKTRGHFPTDDAAIKLLYLALRNIQAKWSKPFPEWHRALPFLALLFGDRFTVDA